jgi:predicted ribosome quality control (RQC) complex YloA/Tae2 family protein
MQLHALLFLAHTHSAFISVNPACHLQASEAALEQDSQRFEEYLKENDAKLQEALRRAEAEGRARADKAAEAKRLAGAIAGIRSEVAKIEEQLQECQRWVYPPWEHVWGWTQPLQHQLHAVLHSAVWLLC